MPSPKVRSTVAISIYITIVFPLLLYNKTIYTAHDESKRAHTANPPSPSSKLREATDTPKNKITEENSIGESQGKYSGYVPR